MRLICTIKPEKKPRQFSNYLKSEGIDNSCEELSDGSCQIWVYDEDRFEQAIDLYKGYNPEDTTYQKTPTREEPPLVARPKKRNLISPAPYGPVSIIILLTVISLFIWAQFERKTGLVPKIPGIIQAPILAPVERGLIFDDPIYFQERDKLFTLYTAQDVEEKKAPSKEAIELITTLQKTPTWMGVYDRTVTYFQGKSPTIAYSGPIFEKISQGEVWRFFTPALLHFDLLHIFFNVLWFIMLGNQIEFRLGWFRYIILILATAVFSNIAQYLMSGPFFMGLSGVVCGMAAFIWARQQVAAWEGYLLHRFTLIFLAIFVVGMFVLQTVFFILQITGQFNFTIGIANTAHLVGALVGYLLGRSRLFSLQRLKCK